MNLNVTYVNMKENSNMKEKSASGNIYIYWCIFVPHIKLYIPSTPSTSCLQQKILQPQHVAPNFLAQLRRCMRNGAATGTDHRQNAAAVAA